MTEAIEITADNLGDGDPAVLALIEENPQALAAFLMASDRALPDPDPSLPIDPEHYLWQYLDPRVQTGFQHIVNRAKERPDGLKFLCRLAQTLNRAFERGDEDNASIRRADKGESFLLDAFLGRRSQLFVNEDSCIIARSYLACLITHAFPEVKERIGEMNEISLAADTFHDIQVSNRLADIAPEDMEPEVFGLISDASTKYFACADPGYVLDIAAIIAGYELTPDTGDKPAL